MKDFQDFSGIGEQIKESLQSALESQDFKKINILVGDTVNQALEEAKAQLKAAFMEESRQGKKPVEKETAAKESGPNYRGETVRTRPVNYGANTNKQLPRVNQADRVPGILFTVFGAIGFGIFGVIAISSLVLLGFSIFAGKVLLPVSLVLAFVFFLMLVQGNSLRARLKRAGRYLELCRGKDYISVKELARLSETSERSLKKDLRAIIRRRIYPEGHMDEKESCLILSDEVYKQYLMTEKAWKERRKKRWFSLFGIKKKNSGDFLKETAAEQSRYDKTEEVKSAEVSGTEETGKKEPEGEEERYIRSLKELESMVQSPFVKEKTKRLSELLVKIFQAAQKHPEQKQELRRFMDYYLPTTVKLIKAYVDFEQTGIEGDNISQAKKEIEQTLETIDDAFENLLDDFYLNAALDASADARVLKNMLTQDGLSD